MDLNKGAKEYFDALSAHDDVADEFRKSLGFLGEYKTHGGADHKAVYASTLDLVFGGAAGMSHIYWRLRQKDYYTALKTGAKPAAEIGPEWVSIEMFRSDWPKPDLSFWALRAYDFARTGQ